MKKLTNFDKWMKHIKNNEEVQHTKLRSIQK